ncbi:MAG: hypothetical protein JSS61_04705 [Verrucomicrobia bacterium]|nr:hypothetical protein [Verrucomicrobiota bacterium]
MNILPLIFAFLLIFTTLAMTFLREVKSFAVIEDSLESFYRAERVLNNEIVKKSYKKNRGKTLTKRTSKGRQQQKKETYRSLRDRYPPLENSKFNIWKLVEHQGEPSTHPLFSPLAKLLDLLYYKTLFAKEKEGAKLSSQIAKELLAAIAKAPEDTPLSELHLKDPELDKLFYYMAKGTNQYDRERGIPPLEDFLSYEKEMATVYVCYAALPVLEALFGPQVAKAVFRKEQDFWAENKKYAPCKKKEFEEILQAQPNKGALFAQLQPFLNHARRAIYGPVMGGRDPATGLGVKIDY